MTYSFDEEIDRKGTSCIKWEFISENGLLIYGDHADPKHGADRLLPMWVADMDFVCPPAVVDALVTRAQHGVFGYCAPTDSYYEAVIDWNARRYGRTVEREWITLAPGVVPAIKALVQTFVAPGEKVLVQRPVYHPFFTAVEKNGREIVSNTLVYENGRYRMDFDDLAQKAADPDLKMAILCSPHNPVGRVWRQDELARFGQICLDNDVLVVSDEVHCDLIYSDATFTTFANMSETFAQNSIICTAPSKSFNIAGLKTSNIIIANNELRHNFAGALERNGLTGANAFGLTAVEAAYNHGEAWLEAAMAYVEANYRFMVDYMSQNLPQLKIIPPEGTYLVWVDFSELGLDPATRKSLLMDQVRVYLDEGKLFGPEGAAFERINIACSRAILTEALQRIKRVVDSLVFF
jgi:cystathionine beta-lyase